MNLRRRPEVPFTTTHLRVGDPATLTALPNRPYGLYKEFRAYGNRLGFFLVAPNGYPVTFASRVIYLDKLESAWIIVDWLIASPARVFQPPPPKKQAKAKKRTPGKTTRRKT